MRTGKGFLMVYDVTSRFTFDEGILFLILQRLSTVTKFREQIYRVQDKDYSERIPFVVAANKADLFERRAISTQEGVELCKAWGVPFRECSAKNRTNIDEVWFDLVREVRKSNPPPSKSKHSKKVCILL
jgi:GTPase KRas protein